MRMMLVGWLVASTLVPLGAHDAAHLPAAEGASVWDLAVLALLTGAGVLYALGSRKLKRRAAHVRPLERVCFWSGLMAMFIAVAPPLDGAAAQRFSAHMVQHELLILIGAPLLIAGRPIVPWLWALPAVLRGRAGSSLRTGVISSTWRGLTTPIVAWALHGAVIWIWHAPVMYEAAVAHEGIHALQHATFVGTAVLFWWGLVYGRYGRAAYGASVLYVFTTMVHTGVLGAMFALSSSPVYGIYRDRAAGAGVDATADQQLAGIYMWIPAGIIMMIFGLALLVAWLSEAERRSKWQRRAAVVLLPLALAGASACQSIPHEEDARRLTGGDPARGRERIAQYGCDTCHTIPGVPSADAAVGPPLTEVARRLYLAGHIENTPENMRRWIQHPREFEPKTVMPDMGISDSDSRDIVAYLYTLR